MVTQDLQVVATNKTRKDIVAGENVKSGSGGVFQGNNAESVSNLENRTAATIGNHAAVSVTGSVLAPGNFLLSAYNEHLGDDEVLLDTGGAIVGSGVKSQIKVNVNDATASIGNFAVIETVGALDMQTRARGELNTHAEAHTYGLAGGAGVDSMVHINNDNLVSIGTDTTVQALGDVNMLAGKDRDGARNFFKIRSHRRRSERDGRADRHAEVARPARTGQRRRHRRAEQGEDRARRQPDRRDAQHRRHRLVRHGQELVDRHRRRHRLAVRRRRVRGREGRHHRAPAVADGHRERPGRGRHPEGSEADDLEGQRQQRVRAHQDHREHRQHQGDHDH